MGQLMFRVTWSFAFVAVAVVVSGGCQAWKVDSRPPEAVIGQARNERVAITMQDRRWVVLDNAAVREDSVVGMRVTGNTVGTGRTALAVSGIRAVEIRRFSFIRTVGLGVVALFVPSLYRLAVVEE